FRSLQKTPDIRSVTVPCKSGQKEQNSIKFIPVPGLHVQPSKLSDYNHFNQERCISQQRTYRYVSCYKDRHEKKSKCHRNHQKTGRQMQETVDQNKTCHYRNSFPSFEPHVKGKVMSQGYPGSRVHSQERTAVAPPVHIVHNQKGRHTFEH